MAKFEIFKGKDNKFYFHLKADNGQIVASSQAYTEKEHAQKGIASIKRIATDAEVIDETES